MNLSDLITVVIPTSPIPRHPATDQLELAIDSIRKHIPEVPILIQFDGVREENKNREESYAEYVRRVRWLCGQKYAGVARYVANGYRHQAELMRETLPTINTPLLVYL